MLTYANTGYAGGIFVQTRVGLNVENSRVVGNVATRSHGGGAYISVDSTLRVSGTTVENNAAGERGGESATFCDLLTIINLFGTAAWSAGSRTDVLLWFCYVQAGFSQSLQ